MPQTQEQEFGNDAIFLSNRGFEVTCIDRSEEAIKHINERNNKLITIISSFEKLDFNKLANFDLIYSNFGIVFCEKNKINKLIENIKNHINSAGFFVGNFLGIEDKWNDENHKDMKFFTSKEVKEIFKDWKIWYISDKHYIMDSSKEKEKNWHVIEIYAQKQEKTMNSFFIQMHRVGLNQYKKCWIL